MIFITLGLGGAALFVGGTIITLVVKIDKDLQDMHDRLDYLNSKGK